MQEYNIENIKIYNCDVFQGLEKIENNSIDLLFIDPPYNLGKVYKGEGKDSWSSEKEYLSWCYKWIDICLDKLKDTGSIYLMCSTQYMPYFDIYLRDKISILSRIIWHYDSSGVQAKNHFGSLYEPIIFGVKNKYKYTFNSSEILIEAKTGSERKLIDHRKKPPQPYNTKKIPGNVWYFPRVRYKMSEYVKHPSQKPEILLERIIKASSNKGDIILDPFSGTLTTATVALKLDRKFIGIEISTEYINDSLFRISR